MNQNDKRPLVLIILDGWGITPDRDGNGIDLAHTPNYDEICKNYPFTTLDASGTSVGLADGVPGNAEIGHRTIGAGRVVYTDASRVARSVSSGELANREVLRAAFGRAASAGTNVHFIGLLSDGGVQSSQDTLFALLRAAKLNGVSNAYVHAILDGRDVQPRTADVYVDALEIKMADIGLGRIASLCGRFYGMDSGENWERTARAFTMLVHGEGERGLDAVTAVRASFLRGISDEFIAPIVIEKGPNEPSSRVQDGDLVVFFNHRGEQMRQLVRSLAVADGSAAKPKIEALCLVEYDAAFGLPVVFPPVEEKNALPTIFEYCGIRNYRITEMSRSLHISSHLNGTVSRAGDFEKNVIVPSVGFPSFETAPESRSFKIADRAMRGIESDRSGVFVVNFPAADMVADAGDLDRTVESVQYIDTCLGGVVQKVKETGGVAIVTSSHSGCERVLARPNGNVPVTGSINPVPFHLIDPSDAEMRLASDGTLADVAPTVLGLLGLKRPPEMSGRDLRNT